MLKLQVKRQNGVEMLESMPQAIAHGAEEGASKIAETATMVGERVAKGAAQAVKTAGQLDVAKRAITPVTGARPRRRGAHAPAWLRPRPRVARPRAVNPDARLRARLDRTSKELAHESSDLNAAITSLNRSIKANRRLARRGRARLFIGALLGAGLMYHLDAEHGRERRAATSRLVMGIVNSRGTAGSPPAGSPAA